MTEFPEQLVLRDTTIYADEGQRIFTTATGYGYEKCEYVRKDLYDEVKRRLDNYNDPTYGKYPS